MKKLAISKRNSMEFIRTWLRISSSRSHLIKESLKNIMSILNNQISWVNNSRVKNFTDKIFTSKHPWPIIILLRDFPKALQLKNLISSKVDYLPIEVRIVMISRNSTIIVQICRQACLEDRMKSIMEGIVRKDCHHGQATSKPPKIRRLTNSDLPVPGIMVNRIRITSNKIKCSQNR